MSASSSTSREAMSRWLVGSSRQSRLAGSASSFASASRVCSPPDRTRTFFSIASPENRKAPSRRRISSVDMRPAAVPSSSNTVLPAARASIWCWAKYATLTFRPSSRVPRSNGRTPARILSSVDLPAPFGPIERDLLAALQREVEPVVHDVVAVGLADVAERDHGASAARWSWEVELHRPPRPSRRLDPVELREGLDPALDLPRLRCLVAEALDEPLGLRDLALLGFAAAASAASRSSRCSTKSA